MRSLLWLLSFIVASSCLPLSSRCERTGECRVGSEAGAPSELAGAPGAAGAVNATAGAGGAPLGEGGQAGSGGDTEPTAGSPAVSCDLNAELADGCAPKEDAAIYVAVDGDDRAPGTAAEPVQTLANALELASARGGVVIACGGTYAENLSLTQGVRLLGGFSCDQRRWSRQSTARASVAPESGVPLTILGVAFPIEIADFDFVASDAQAAGESSIAAFVAASLRVTLRRVTLSAGAGADGTNGSLTPYDFSELDLRGNNATSSTTAAQKLCTCPGGVVTRGGAGGAQDQNGGSGAPAYKVLADDGKGGDTTLACSAGGAGIAGGVGADAAYALGAEKLGTLSIAGWLPAPGSDAADGKPGQGGGGGAGKANGGGGGGGCGACGGHGGGAGSGGGASIALLSLNSPVQLRACSLSSARAGNGGAGVPGQAAQATAGPGGSGYSAGCSGGKGGAAGKGGASGGGAGGVSLGVGYSGKKPLLDAQSQVQLGSPGVAGDGGEPGNNDGLPGVAAEELSLD